MVCNRHDRLCGKTCSASLGIFPLHIHTLPPPFLRSPHHLFLRICSTAPMMARNRTTKFSVLQLATSEGRRQLSSSFLKAKDPGKINQLNQLPRFESQLSMHLYNWPCPLVGPDDPVTLSFPFSRLFIHPSIHSNRSFKLFIHQKHLFILIQQGAHIGHN